MSQTAASITGAQPATLSPADIESMVQRFLAKGNTEQQVGVLMSENFQYREKNRLLTEQITQLQAKVPAEGSLVLTGEDLKLHNDLIALKLKPDEITALQTELTNVKGEVETAKRKEAITAAAAAENYDATVLATLIGDKTLVVKPVDEEVDGEKKKVDRAFIVTVDPTSKVQTEERLSEHVTKHHEKFLPSLTAETEDAGGGGGTPFPRQRASTGGGKPAKSDASQAYIAGRYKTQPAQGAGK